MRETRTIYTPYETIWKDDELIDYKDHDSFACLDNAKRYCIQTGITCISACYQEYDRNIENDWHTENSQTICLLNNGIWENVDHKQLESH